MPILSIEKITAVSPNGETFNVFPGSSATGQTVSGTWQVTVTLSDGKNITFDENADSEGQAVESATGKVEQYIDAVNNDVNGAHIGHGTERENQEDTGDGGAADPGNTNPDDGTDDGGDGSDADTMEADASDDSGDESDDVDGSSGEQRNERMS